MLINGHCFILNQLWNEISIIIHWRLRKHVILMSIATKNPLSILSIQPIYILSSSLIKFTKMFICYHEINKGNTCIQNIVY